MGCVCGEDAVDQALRYAEVLARIEESVEFRFRQMLRYRGIFGEHFAQVPSLRPRPQTGD